MVGVRVIGVSMDDVQLHLVNQSVMVRVLHSGDLALAGGRAGVAGDGVAVVAGLAAPDPAVAADREVVVGMVEKGIEKVGRPALAGGPGQNIGQTVVVDVRDGTVVHIGAITGELREDEREDLLREGHNVLTSGVHLESALKMTIGVPVVDAIIGPELGQAVIIEVAAA
jgi:hypothetical protein